MRALLCLPLLIVVALAGQAQTLITAFNLGSAAGYENGDDIVMDASGNVWVAGYFQNTVDFDPGAGTLSRTSTSGSYDSYLASYTSAGAVNWALRVGNANADQGSGVAIDASGNAYLSGYFAGTLDLDPGAGTVNVSSGAGDDGYLIKVNSAGAFQWGFKLGGSGYDYIHDVETDANGDVYITGYFQGTVDFNPGAGTNNLVSAGSMDMFLAKYSSAGVYLWAFRVGAGSFADEFGYELATFGSSDVYVTGSYGGTVDFDPGAGTTSRTNSGGNDIFLAKYSSAGAFQWVFTGSGSSTDDGTGVDVDAAGNVYFSGGFEGTIDFDPGAGTANLTSAGVFDIFLAKYTSAGALTFAQRIGSTINDRSYHMATNAGGTTLLTGYITGTVDMNPGAGTANLTSAGSFDAIVACYDAAGTYQWAFRLGGANLDIGYAVDINDACNFAITGYFEGTTDFDPGAGTFNLTSLGGFDAYVGIYGGGCSVLSAQAPQLKAAADGQRIHLAWDRQPLPGETFTLLRSHDQQQWQPIHHTGSQFPSTETWDEHPHPGVNYYQLQLADLQGTTTLSNLAHINLAAASQWALLPQPATDHLTLWSTHPEALTLDVYNMWGQHCVTWQPTPGQQISLDGFPAGQYHVRCKQFPTHSLPLLIAR